MMMILMITIMLKWSQEPLALSCCFCKQRQQSALHLAVENGLANVVEELLVAGADLEAKEKVRGAQPPLGLKMC